MSLRFKLSHRSLQAGARPLEGEFVRHRAPCIAWRRERALPVGAAAQARTASRATRFCRRSPGVRGSQSLTTRTGGHYEALESTARTDQDGAREEARFGERPRRRDPRGYSRLLSRRTKNNPVLIGEPGVGKT